MNLRVVMLMGEVMSARRGSCRGTAAGAAVAGWLVALLGFCAARSGKRQGAGVDLHCVRDSEG